MILTSLRNTVIAGLSELNDVLSARNGLCDSGLQELNRRVRRDLMRMCARNDAIPSLPKRLGFNLVLQFRATRGIGGVIAASRACITRVIAASRACA